MELVAKILDSLRPFIATIRIRGGLPCVWDGTINGRRGETGQKLPYYENKLLLSLIEPLASLNRPDILLSLQRRRRTEGAGGMETEAETETVCV